MPKPSWGLGVVREAFFRLLPANYDDSPVTIPVASDDQCPTHISWTTVSTNVIAAVLATAILAMSGGVVYLVWEMPRQQERIIESQAQIKEALREKGLRLERLELNDRVQDERLRQLGGHR